MTKHLIVSTPDENGNFTHSKFYTDELDEVIATFEEKLKKIMQIFRKNTNYIYSSSK